MTVHQLQTRIPLERSEIIVAGVARNCAHTLRDEIVTLKRAFGSARALKFLVIESDSDDQTVRTLRDLSNELDLAYLSLGSLREEIPLRSDRIAHCRNQYLGHIAADPHLARADYVAVADFDGVNRCLTEAAVASCWVSSADWDVCTANQRDYYYDIWALRHAAWCPEDCWQQYR